MAKCITFTLDKKEATDLYCSECMDNGITEWVIKPGDTYLTVKISTDMTTRFYLYLCLNCVDKIYPEIREKFDPSLRFYL